jgi:ribosomal protein S17E
MDMLLCLSGIPHTNESSAVLSTNDKVIKFTALISPHKLRNLISFYITEHTNKLLRPKLTETVKQHLH